jgi:hypothetical protein
MGEAVRESVEFPITYFPSVEKERGTVGKPLSGLRENVSECRFRVTKAVGNSALIKIEPRPICGLRHDSNHRETSLPDLRLIRIRFSQYSYLREKPSF